MPTAPLLGVGVGVGVKPSTKSLKRGFAGKEGVNVFQEELRFIHRK